MKVTKQQVEIAKENIARHRGVSEYKIDEGDLVYCVYTGISGTVHLITNEGRLIVQWETGLITFTTEPRDVTKKTEQAATCPA